MAASAQGVHATTLIPGFDANTLPANDDQSAGPIALGFTADFFGQPYTSVYVNNNGNITFIGPQVTYTPTGLGSNYTAAPPIIAPFFADVDTRGQGSGLVSYGTGTYQGHAAFGVTYPNVGYYQDGTDKLNSFQVILTERSDVAPGNFDILFNYQQISWETGDRSGGTDGLGGTSAAAGFSNGTGQPGTYYELPGSLQDGAFLDGGPQSLAGHSTNGVPGQYLYKVRNGTVEMPTVPLPGSAPLFGGALLTLGIVGSRLKARESRSGRARRAI